MNCVELPKLLVSCVHEANNHIIQHMVNSSIDPVDVCINNQVTFDKYYELLGSSWKKIFDNIQNKSNCKSLLSMLKANPDLSMKYIKKFTDKDTINSLLNEDPNTYINMLKGIDSDENLDKFISSYVIPRYIDNQDVTFEMNPDGIKTLKLAGNIIFDHCVCQMHVIFDKMMSVYGVRLRKDIPRDQLKSEMISIYKEFKNILQSFMSNNILEQKGGLEGNNTDPAKSFIGEELNRLIPDSLGSLKQFFITVISTYYSKLHPIIWGQILLKSYDNFFDIDGTPGALPITKDEFFQFFSRQTLLNSGPFILKTLQMIRPVLTPELATKYNLTSLKYPQLKNDQIEIILRNVTNFDMITIMRNVSASVGHVCIAYENKDKNNIFVIKIIKPVSIAQSCWEYKTLFPVFPNGSCERDFVINMLKSNGREMNVLNEIENIEKGNKYYSADYSSVFGIDIKASLGAIKEHKGVVKAGSWYAMAMTLAPGLPVSDLVEKDLLKEDTKYRSILHRCLDLLVYKFFHNIIQAGFYHGDLHAGNMFYSYKEQAITLIDFGAVGELDLINKRDSTTDAFIKIIIMSIFYNYDGILDFLTDLLNSKCVDEKTNIPKGSEAYEALRRELIGLKETNIMYADEERRISGENIEKLFSSERVKVEQSDQVDGNIVGQEEKMVFDSMYSYLEVGNKARETVDQNADRLPVTIETIANKQTISFVGVLEKILAFYALNGVNIAIKFSDFYEFQKAYLLLLGVLHKVGYSSYRIGMSIKKGIANTGNIFKMIQNPGLLWFIIKSYREQQGLYGKEDTKDIKVGIKELESKKGMNVEQLQQELDNLSKRLNELMAKK